MLAPSQSRAGHLILLWAMSSASSMNALVTVHTENIATSSRVEMLAWGQTARYLTPYSTVCQEPTEDFRDYISPDNRKSDPRPVVPQNGKW